MSTVKTRFVIVSDCVTCHYTYGPNLSTCEISPEQNEFCIVECTRDRDSSKYLCSQDCDTHCTYGNATTDDFIFICCTTSYCNAPNKFITMSSSVSTPFPTNSELIWIQL